MVVGMALVAVRGAMAVAVIVMAVAVMVVVMAAATPLAMGVLVLVAMIVLVAMRVIMAVVVVMVMVVPAAAVVAMGVVMHFRLRLERALDLGHGAALPAHQLGEGRVAGDIERVGRHLRRDVVPAEMPGEAHQPQRILGADFQQLLRCGFDLDEAAILQLQRVAVVQRRRLVEGDREFQAARGRHGDAVDIAVPVPEAERIGDALGADSGLANDGSGAKHDEHP